MKINWKSVWLFISCLAVVIGTHTEVLVKYPEWFKDAATVISLAIVSMNRKLIEKDSTEETEDESKS